MSRTAAWLTVKRVVARAGIEDMDMITPLAALVIMLHVHELTAQYEDHGLWDTTAYQAIPP